MVRAVYKCGRLDPEAAYGGVALGPWPLIAGDSLVAV
jgi:hypothetical protein